MLLKMMLMALAKQDTVVRIFGFSMEPKIESLSNISPEAILKQ
jgi:hypothetical protein